MAEALTTAHLQILQHALGVDEYGRGQQYRNHFCAGGGDEPTCRELVAMGYMTTFKRSSLPYYNCTVTEEGKTAMLRESSAPPVLSRAQVRYRHWLTVSDCFPDWKFGDYLKKYASLKEERASLLGDYL